MPARPRRYMNPEKIDRKRYTELRGVYNGSRMFHLNQGERYVLSWYFHPNRIGAPVWCQREEDFLRKYSESEIEGLKQQIGNLLFRINLVNCSRPAKKRSA